MNKAKWAAWSIVIVATVLGLLTLLIPPPPQNPEAFRGLIVPSTIDAVLQLGAAILFLLGLGRFKTRLRITYGLICSAILLLGVAQIQPPIIALYNLGNSAWVSSGLVVVPFVAPVILFLLAAKQYAKLLETHTILASFWVAFAIAVAAGLLASLLPPSPLSSNPIESRATIALSIWGDTFVVLSIIVMMKVRRAAGQIYQQPLQWYIIALVVLVASGFFSVVQVALFGTQSYLATHGYTMWPHVIGALLFVRAGYAFLTIDSQADDIKFIRAEAASMLDVVMYAAAQASNPRHIEPIMDKVRGITAKMQTGQAPTPQQEREFRNVYFSLEDYLVNHDPLRKFNADKLRDQIHQKFHLQLASAR